MLPAFFLPCSSAALPWLYIACGLGKKEPSTGTTTYFVRLTGIATCPPNQSIRAWDVVLGQGFVRLFNTVSIVPWCETAVAKAEWNGMECPDHSLIRTALHARRAPPPPPPTTTVLHTTDVPGPGQLPRDKAASRQPPAAFPLAPVLFTDKLRRTYVLRPASCVLRPTVRYGGRGSGRIQLRYRLNNGRIQRVARPRIMECHSDGELSTARKERNNNAQGLVRAGPPSVSVLKSEVHCGEMNRLLGSQWVFPVRSYYFDYYVIPAIWFIVVLRRAGCFGAGMGWDEKRRDRRSLAQGSGRDGEGGSVSLEHLRFGRHIIHMFLFGVDVQLLLRCQVERRRFNLPAICQRRELSGFASHHSVSDEEAGSGKQEAGSRKHKAQSTKHSLSRLSRSCCD
ncbi:hypothetical protein MBM_02352 [Drepanopeziza brunnea f. sp. 'multigermtubi' MB_m1]|uniref:Uncharacterized protein n=1 Tax=Marssonina brunnea f. sp. multigermtubi (strain MB_m1) TaxID=1072389 RepID=K1WN63_MARBU|nr:uncharacterized protein MBM_02352 [Drepanopeziza brunnea f. sp. 'multigermtubi' MB_m1]EKD19115.1 hypothetical protein MBM_02352 [Drepanopeziza brunnea f. sp. 'multigermtubi' MB_m1]